MLPYHYEAQAPCAALTGFPKINATDEGPTGTGAVTPCILPFLLNVNVLHQECIAVLATIATKHSIILKFPWMCFHGPQITNKRGHRKWSLTITVGHNIADCIDGSFGIATLSLTDKKYPFRVW